MNSKNRWIAFSLSAFLLPGLGQTYLGERKKGWFFILTSLSLLVLLLGKYMMAIFKIIQNFPRATPVSVQIPQSLWKAFALEKSVLLLGLGILAILWLWAALDTLRKRENTA